MTESAPVCVLLSRYPGAFAVCRVSKNVSKERKPSEKQSNVHRV